MREWKVNRAIPLLKKWKLILVLRNHFMSLVLKSWFSLSLRVSLPTLASLRKSLWIKTVCVLDHRMTVTTLPVLTSVCSFLCLYNILLHEFDTAHGLEFYYEKPGCLQFGTIQKQCCYSCFCFKHKGHTLSSRYLKISFHETLVLSFVED